jgi:RNA polymerase sigma-70 factor (ECF subfamily)
MLLHNLANFRRRYLATDKRRLDREVALPGTDSSSLGPKAVPAAGPTPSAHAVHREQAQALQRALERLPEDYRRIIALRYDEHLSFDDIARILDRSANAVRKLWARAIARLQEEMEGPA